MLYHLMVKPNSSKATCDKKFGYSNTFKTNNTTYVSHKDKLYLKLSKFLYNSVEVAQIFNDIKLDFLYRKLDQCSWQYCNKGFFNFKNYIPKIISTFN